MFMKFNLKKVIKNKFNLIPIILVLLAIITCFYFNNKNYKTFNFEYINKSELQNTLINKKKSDSIANDKKSSVDEKNAASSTSKMYARDISQYKNILRYYKNNQRTSAYNIRVDQIENDLKITKKDKSYNGLELINAINRELQYYKYLGRYNLVMDPEDFPSQGISYMNWVARYLMPIAIVISIIFIGIQLFSDDYQKSINISKVLPLSETQKTLTQIGVIVMFGIILLLVSLAIALLLGTIFKGVGTFRTPILSYFGIDKYKYIPIGAVFGKSIVLEVFNIITTVLFSYLLVQIFKNKMAALLCAIVAELGLMLLTTLVEPLQRIAQFLPTTYLSSVDIVTGTTGNSLENMMINFNSGILINTIFIVIFIICIYFYKKATTKTNLA